MENCSLKLLETAVLRTLHANAFSRSSTAASHLLTDLLARYLVLIAASTATHAQHAGRTSLAIHDALAALEDFGVATDELTNFATIEAKELSRYAVYSSRRIEDLNELRAQLADGLKQDRDDRIHLTYAPYDTQEQPVDEADDENEEDEEAMQVDQTPIMVPPKLYSPRHMSPRPLPPSPSRKRLRTDHWYPPEHVPHFLPPFPPASPLSPVSPRPAPLPEIEEHQMLPPMPPPLPPSLTIRPQIPPVMPPPLTTTAQHTMTSSAASDYLVQVPYSQSSLSSVPEWHLPASMPSAPTMYQRTPAHILPTPQTEHSLLAAYHYILTHPPPLQPLFPGRATIPAGATDVPIGPNTLLPSRHKVAMTLLYQTQALSRWDPADSLFGTVSPCAPRAAAIGPTYPIPTDDKERSAKDFKFPPVLARTVGAPERIAPVVSQQGSRIPDLARHVLPPLIFSRTSRLAHPPILHRGQKPLTYGQGVPAPWNNNPEAAPGAATAAVAPAPTPSTPNTPNAPFKPFKLGTGDPGAKNTALNGKLSDMRDKEKDKDKGGPGQQGQATKPTAPLPEARLFATWDYEPKDYRIPLAIPTRSRARMASMAAGSGVGVGTGAGDAGTLVVGSAAGLRSRSASRMVTG